MEYSIRRSARARHIRLTVHPGGRVVLTLPLRASLATGEAFVRSRTVWIARMQAKMRTLPDPEVRRASSKVEFKKYAEAARDLGLALIIEWSERIGVQVKRLAIRNQKTRWGSASKKGVVNLNYRIAVIPRPLAEYIVVHELAHLRHMNHSAKFWTIVKSAIPDYKARIRALHKIGREVL